MTPPLLHVEAPDGCVALRAGELLLLSGDAGAGKSTLVRHLLGLDGGVEGARWRDDVPPSMRGILWQRALPDASAATLRAALIRASRGGPEDVDALATELGIEGCLEQDPLHLGRAERQIAALAQELCRGCRVLVMDEPFAGLPPAMARRMRGAIERRRRERGLAVLATTHQRAPDQGQEHQLMDLEPMTPSQGAGAPSPRRRLPAWLAMSHALAATAGAAWLSDPRALGALAAWLLAVFALTRPGARALARALGFFGVVGLAAFAVLLIRHPAEAAVGLALRATLKTLCLFLPFRVLLRVTTPGDLFAALAVALPRRLALLVLVALQQAPLLGREARRHRDALRARGGSVLPRRGALRVGLWRLVVPAVVLALSTADRLALALELHPASQSGTMKDRPETPPRPEVIDAP